MALRLGCPRAQGRPFAFGKKGREGGLQQGVGEKSGPGRRTGIGVRVVRELGSVLGCGHQPDGFVLRSAWLLMGSSGRAGFSFHCFSFVFSSLSRLVGHLGRARAPELPRVVVSCGGAGW